MQQITISGELIQRVPGIELSCIACDVQVERINLQLWNKILKEIKKRKEEIKIEEISKIPAISASRKAYRACGKDPARYRLSAEALLRRIVKRGEIYQVNNVVDILNLVSVSSGFSIGGYDSGKIAGNITFGIGKKHEPYSGIGRGELNIESMPVFRDDQGAFGTPTSDSQRTMVTEETNRFLMIIIGYSPTEELQESTEMAVDLLKRYAGAASFDIQRIGK